MRQRFNTGKYRERVESGELTAKVTHEGEPKGEMAVKEPTGTVSQSVSYLDSECNEVARVHQYLRPDGAIGASGMPDPKRLFEGGIFYRLIKTKPLGAEGSESE
jgi:hypothetical protein